MNFVSVLVVAVVFVASAFGRQHHDPCQLCKVVINIASHHLQNNPNWSMQQMRAELHQDCARVFHFAAAQCDAFVASHTQTIYNDLKAGKTGEQTCVDVGLCSSQAPAPFRRVKRQMSMCHPCELLLNIAIRIMQHENHGHYTEDQLRAELQMECDRAPHNLRGPCNQLITQHMDQIYHDLAVNHDNGRQACQDLHVC